MKPALSQILDQISGPRKIDLEIVFGDASWRKQVPAEAGWYLIRTNAPIGALRATPLPVAGLRYKIARRVEESEDMPGVGSVILQHGQELWTVYNGYAANLKSRAREHQRGDKGTGCLAIEFYEGLRAYEWRFEFFPVSRLSEGFASHKLLLNLVEQAWRARNGWPILCKG